MNNLTVVIPYASYHADSVARARRSVQSQTIPCDIVVIEDKEGNGAGWARNRGLDQVKTPFVTFLDADDELHPKFAELCLGIMAAWRANNPTSNRYIYTDWFEGGITRKAPSPCELWTQQTYHLVTTMLHTEDVRRIGGFDEVLPALEDTDFGTRLRLAGICGIHIESPLLTYHKGGQRSLNARLSGLEATAKAYLTDRYGGYTFMGCCGDNEPHPLTPENEPLAGDVLVQAQWHGNRRERGRVTGRLYHYTSHPHLLYVAEADANMSPMLFRRISSPAQVQNGVVLQPQYQADSNWQAVVNTVFGGAAIPQQPSKPIEYKPNISGRSKKATIEAAQEWVKVEGDLE